MPAIYDVDADNVLLSLLLTPEGRANPYEHYRELRDIAPVLRSSFGPLVLSRYDDCLEALRDRRLGRGTALRAAGETAALGFVGLDADPERRQAFFERAGDNMLFADPPDHTRLRRLVGRAFTPQRVEALRPAVEAIVDSYVDTMIDAGEVDVMTALAFPLPVTVIGELLGVPTADRAGFQPLVRAAVAGLDPASDPDLLGAAITAIALQFFVRVGNVTIDAVSWFLGAFLACSMGVAVGALLVNFFMGAGRGSDMNTLEL